MTIVIVYNTTIVIVERWVSEMTVKLFDSELKIMEVLWKEGDLSAGRLAAILKEQTGWNRNTTYTVIKKLVDKGAVARNEPGFVCSALITKDQVRQQEASDLLSKLFDDSAELFLSAYLSGKKLPPEEIRRLKALVEKLD